MSPPEPDAPSVEIFVNVEGEGDPPTTDIERAVGLTLAEAGVGRAEISVTLVPDGAIRKLNLEYLDRDRVTDVIAFTLDASDGVLGDVYVGYEQADRQAAEAGIPLATELVRLAIHGTLHVLGHDHPEGEERDESPMFALQERLVAKVFEDGQASAPSR